MLRTEKSVIQDNRICVVRLVVQVEFMLLNRRWSAYDVCTLLLNATEHFLELNPVSLQDERIKKNMTENFVYHIASLVPRLPSPGNEKRAKTEGSLVE